MGITQFCSMIGAAVVLLAGCGSVQVTPAAASAAPLGGTDIPPCAEGCVQRFDLRLAADVRFLGQDGAPSAAGVGASRLVYVVGDRARAVLPTPELDHVQQAVCGYSPAGERCAVSFAVGAHSAAVISVLLTPERGIEITDRFGGDAGDAVLTDLNGDGRPDAVVRGSTYQPAYAGAPQYWQSAVEQDGKFTITGCGPIEPSRSPLPTEPLTAACPPP